MSIRYPETALVAVNTHGQIAQETSGQRFKFQETIPDSRIIIINATAPGVSNYTDEIHTTGKEEIILEEFANTTDIDEFVRLVVPELKAYDKYNVKLSKGSSPDKKNYRNLFSRGYKVQKKRNNDSMIEKWFSINNSEYQEKQMFAERNLDDYSIKVLNAENAEGRNGVDILTMSPPTILLENKRVVSLERLIRFLNRSGVKNIIIFDFSCNNFVDKYSPRTERRKRRDIEKDMDMNLVPNPRKKTRRARVERTNSDTVRSTVRSHKRKRKSR